MDDQQPPAPAEGTPGPTLPFENSESSFGSGLIETIKLFILDPSEAYDRMPLSTDLARPLIYAVLVGWIGAGAAYLWGLVFQAGIASLIGQLDETGTFLPAMLLGMTFGIVGLLIAPIAILIRIFIFTTIVHLSLLLVGGERNGFAATLRVVCYSATSQLAQAIPFAGGMVATVWGLILCVVGLLRAHQTTPGRAVLAIVLPIVFCCVCGGLFVLSAFMLGMGMGMQGQ